jgi:hypothetical protein
VGKGGQFYFMREQLEARAGRLCLPYAQAQPFPHVVVDAFFPDDVVQRIIDEFPPLDEAHWHGSGVRNPQRQLKHMSQNEEAFSPFIRNVLYQLNARPFIQFVESVTGIAPLLPDPDVGHTLRHFERGGSLGVHTDFNWHQGLELHRRVNLIVYLNRDWRDEYGGHLELWDDAMTRCVKRIAPVANRAVLFATNDRTPHGFPEPLACPPGLTRKTMQMYYYTSRIPESDRSAPHRTLFRQRPGERIPAPVARDRRFRALVEDLTPPILCRALRRICGAVRS